MNKGFHITVKSKHLQYVLLALAVVLLGMGGLGLLGVKIPEKLSSELSNAVIFVALGVFLYNRKLRADEAKAKAAAAEAEKAIEEEQAGSLKDGEAGS